MAACSRSSTSRARGRRRHPLRARALAAEAGAMARRHRRELQQGMLAAEIKRLRRRLGIKTERSPELVRRQTRDRVRAHRARALR